MHIDAALQDRQFCARFIMMKAGCQNLRIEQAFAAIPRALFLGPRPWWVPTRNGYVRVQPDDTLFANQDVIVALDRQKHIHSGKPSIHALLLHKIAPQQGESVIHVGAGTGYYSAILAYLVGCTGSVTAYELDPRLAQHAARNLASCPWAKVISGSAMTTNLPPADIIYVNVAMSRPYRPWLDALRPGGRLLFPLQAERGAGMMLMVTRPAEGAAWPAIFVSRAGVACVCGQDKAEADSIIKAFQAGGWENVRSLRLDPVEPQHCWLRGKDWWLST